MVAHEINAAEVGGRYICSWADIPIRTTRIYPISCFNFWLYQLLCQLIGCPYIPYGIQKQHIINNKNASLYKYSCVNISYLKIVS
jgi:hypothetical protein